MEFISSRPKFSYKFINHFRDFVESYKLFDRESALMVAVSGGVDSMAIVYALVHLRKFGYSNDIRVVHINHNTRDNQLDEQELVQNFCKVLNVKFFSTKLKGLDTNKNFENDARVKRYDFFYKQKKPGEKIVLGHHIDDSFEWTMLQSLRSSSVEGQVGIPVVNGSIIRPFMCMSKNHIKQFVAAHNLPFLEDPTNEHLRHERNFIRASVVSSFSSRYPSYLKHYVSRHNEIARRLNLHYRDNKISSFNLRISLDTALVYSIKTSFDSSGLEELIHKALVHLSNKSRGTVSAQIKKIIQAMNNNKYGPLTLTGGVKVFLDFNMIFMTKKSYQSTSVIKTSKAIMSIEQYRTYLHDKIPDINTLGSFPFLVKVLSPGIDKRNFNTSFNTEIVRKLKAVKANYYPALKLFREWSKKRNHHKILHLEFYERV